MSPYHQLWQALATAQMAGSPDDFGLRDVGMPILLSTGPLSAADPTLPAARGGIKKNEPCRAADSYKTLAVESREDLDTRSMRLQTSHSSQHNTSGRVSDTHVRLTNFCIA